MRVLLFTVGRDNAPVEKKELDYSEFEKRKQRRVAEKEGRAAK